MLPWQPNHVTNQTVPSDLCKSNWPFANALWQQQFARFLSLCLSLVLCLCLLVFSLAGTGEQGTSSSTYWCTWCWVEGKAKAKGKRYQSRRGGLSRGVEAQLERRGEDQRPWPQSEISLMHKVKSRHRAERRKTALQVLDIHSDTILSGLLCWG